MAQTPEEAASATTAAAAAAAVLSQQSPFRNSWRSPSLFCRKTPGGDKSGRHRSPTPGAAKGGRSDSLCFYHSHFGNKAHNCEKGSSNVTHCLSRCFSFSARNVSCRSESSI